MCVNYFHYPSQNYAVDYHIQVALIATFYTSFLNIGMQRNLISNYQNVSKYYEM